MSFIKLKWILMLIGIIILVPVVLFTLSFSPPKTNNPLFAPTPTAIIVNTTGDREISIIRTSPSDGQDDADYTGGVTILFDKPVSVKNVTFSFNPSIPGSTTQIDERSVLFTPSEELQRETVYSLSVSVDGKTLTLPNKKVGSNYTWTFKTDVPTGEEAFDEEEVINFQKSRAAAEKAYTLRKQRFPFITKLPYRSSRFDIDIAMNDSIIITTHELNSSQKQAYRNEALSWLRANGGDMDNLLITYLSLPN
jgi:hypothetical protein